MIERVAIYGAGGLGREILQAIRDLRESGTAIECIGFVVDPPFVSSQFVSGVPVYQDFRTLAEDNSVRFVIALGSPAGRAKIAEAVESAQGPRFATIVHPRAVMGASVSVGVGSMIMGLSSLTSECRLGRHVLINPGCTVAHDNVIEDFATLSPGVNLAGRVRVGEGCMLGVGANVAPDVKLGSWSVIGAGACVLGDVPPNTIAVGVPARPVSKRQSEEHIP